MKQIHSQAMMNHHYKMGASDKYTLGYFSFYNLPNGRVGILNCQDLHTNQLAQVTLGIFDSINPCFLMVITGFGTNIKIMIVQWGVWSLIWAWD